MADVSIFEIKSSDAKRRIHNLKWAVPTIIVVIVLLAVLFLKSVFGLHGNQGFALGALEINIETVATAFNDETAIGPQKSMTHENTDESLDEHLPDNTEPEDIRSGGSNYASDDGMQRVWHEPWDEQVLVSAAWVEEIYHPAVYSTVHHQEAGHYGSRCNQCEQDITYFESDHIKERWPLCWSYTNMYWFIDSPEWYEQVLSSAAWTEYINHPAVYRTEHHDGWWE